MVFCNISIEASLGVKSVGVPALPNLSKPRRISGAKITGIASNKAGIVVYKKKKKKN